MLFVITVLLQTFFLDRLTLSVYFAPVVYTAVLFLLPVNAPPIVNLLTALAAGAVTDLLTGIPGLNTIATLTAGYVRRPLLTLIVGRDGMRDGGIPSSSAMGARNYAKYLVAITMLHSAVFFAFEVFSFGHLFHTLLRFVAGTLSSLLFMWVVGRLFTSKISARQ